MNLANDGLMTMKLMTLMELMMTCTRDRALLVLIESGAELKAAPTRASMWRAR